MKKFSKILLPASLVALSAAPAFAGNKVSVPVTVDATNRFAEGAFGSARSSTDSNQQISCYFFSYATGYSAGACYAMSATGVSVGCSFSSETLIDAVRSLPSDGWLYFSWDANGGCTLIELENGSRYEPKK